MVHWDKKKLKKMLLAQLSALALIATGVIAIDSGSQATDTFTHRLKVVRSMTLPGRELSGFTMRPTSGAKQELFAIGDSDAQLTRLTLNSDSWADAAAATQTDLGPVLRQTFGICHSKSSRACKKQLESVTSQWEALAVDASGRLFALQENTDAIVVFAPGLGRVDAVLSFDFFNGHIKATKKSENSLGESLILLKKGHILVAKESFPTVIMEFGPAGETALGYSAATRLEAGENFALPPQDSASGPVNRIDLVPLAAWGRSGTADGCDISELALGSEGLHVLSQRCGTISLFSDLPPQESQLKPARVWRLPKKVKNPEALVVVGPGHFIVGSDIKSDQANTFEVVVK